MKDTRLPEYHYWNQLLEHIGSPDRIFSGEFVWPRQFEIHLPADHKRPCNLACPHCAGKLFDRKLGTWEMEGLELLDKLHGAIPFHIYGGAYTEPLMNPYYLTFLAMTKKYGNHFGMHVNGSTLSALEENIGFLTELNRISTDRTDYLSISIDAGTAWSWAKTKGTRKWQGFYDIIGASRTAVGIRMEAGKGHSIRWCYLISKDSESKEDIDVIVGLAKAIGVDSLRFSIPFDNYNKQFDAVRQYKAEREIPDNARYEAMLEPYLSKSQDEKPYIFYTQPEFTDIDRFNFGKCVYGYYQITFGADGYCYKCSTVATPTAKQCRLGKITADLEDFKKMIRTNQNEKWDCQMLCFDRGLRCNRMGMECNTTYQGMK